MVHVMDQQGIEQSNFLSALKLKPFDLHRISVVGAGGKTTLIQALAEEFSKVLPDVIVTPTTKIYPPNYGKIVLKESMKMLQLQHGIVTLGLLWKQGKLTGVSKEFLQKIFLKYPVVLMEADGAKGFPSKIPAEGEPVIPRETTIVLAVQGIDALNRSIREVCFRTEKVCAFLGKGEEELLTAEDMAKIYLSTKGLKKDVGKKNYWAVIQKVETEADKQKAMKVIKELEKRKFHQILMTCRKENQQ